MKLFLKIAVAVLAIIIIFTVIYGFPRQTHQASFFYFEVDDDGYAFEVAGSSGMDFYVFSTKRLADRDLFIKFYHTPLPIRKSAIYEARVSQDMRNIDNVYYVRDERVGDYRLLWSRDTTKELYVIKDLSEIVTRIEDEDGFVYWVPK